MKKTKTGEALNGYEQAMTYHKRVLAYEAKGCTTSDAQAICDAENRKGNPMPSTMTDLGKAVKEGARYWLGPVVAVHTIGGYAFLEYKEKVFSPNPDAGTIKANTCFSIFIDETHIGRCAPSLDMAIIIALANKYDGPNTGADRYFIRMVNMEKEERP